MESTLRFQIHRFPFNFFAGAPDSSLSDIDLLGTIGEPLPLGVTLTKGPHTKPALHFRPVANVGRFARYIFPTQFFTEFSISLVIRPKLSERSVVFALLSHYRRGTVILGLEIQNVAGDSIIRLTHAPDEETKTVFDFTVPDINGKWSWLGFSIRKDGVTFYLDCNAAETKSKPSFLGDLTIPIYSALYIGRAGWTAGAQSNAFEVSRVLAFEVVYVKLLWWFSATEYISVIISSCTFLKWHLTSMKKFSLFPSCSKPLFQSEAKCEAMGMKMIFLFSFKLNSISQKRVLHLASL